MGFTPSDFLDVAGAAVDQALSHLVKSGKLRRLARGLYDYAKVHPKLGQLSPAPDDVARALARETGSKAQIAGAHAANALGLSTQVPAKSLYLTDGPSRRVVLGRFRPQRAARLCERDRFHCLGCDCAAGVTSRDDGWLLRRLARLAPRAATRWNCDPAADHPGRLPDIAVAGGSTRQLLSESSIPAFLQ